MADITLTTGERDLLREKLCAYCEQNFDLELEQLPGFEPTEPVPPPPVAQDGNGGIKGRRPSKKDKLRAAAAAAKQQPAD